MSLCYKAEVLRVRLHFLHHSKNFLFAWNIYHTNRSITTNDYNMDAIISVGYRVNSIQATKFRIWATGILKEYMIKGFAMDDERLKQGKTAFGKDYFRELLERDRSIRASERRIWQQITDIFAVCSIDYDRDSDTAYHFYATIQNKFHYAITGKTATEIVYNQADHTKENMGLTTWKNAPDGRILKSDTPIAKKLFGRETDSSVRTCCYRIF